MCDLCRTRGPGSPHSKPQSSAEDALPCGLLLCSLTKLWRLKEEKSKAVCFGSVKVWPYLLRLLTAMHTARINASTTRATTMISQSVGTDGEGKRARECISCGFAISQNCKNTISSTSLKLSHSFPSFHECLLGLQSLSVQIKHIFIIQLHTGSSD